MRFLFLMLIALAVGMLCLTPSVEAQGCGSGNSGGGCGVGSSGGGCGVVSSGGGFNTRQRIDNNRILISPRARAIAPQPATLPAPAELNSTLVRRAQATDAQFVMRTRPSGQIFIPSQHFRLQKVAQRDPRTGETFFTIRQGVYNE